MAHDLFRAGRFVMVAILALLATACETLDHSENAQKTALVDASGQSAARPDETRLAEVQLQVGRAAFDQGSVATALDLFEKAHKNSPATGAPLIAKGDALFALQRFAAAEAAYRAALLRAPGSYEANEGLGKTLVTLKKFHEGLRAFEAARAVRADAGLINKIGVTHELLGNGAAAQAHFREALELDPTSLTVRNNLALSLAVSGSYDAALREMETVVASPKSSERHHANLAFIYGLAGRPLDGAPAQVSRAAANKGWDENFFARTRKAAESGDRAAVLDLLHNRTASAPVPAPAEPAAAQLPEMPESAEQPAMAADSAPPPAGAAAASSPVALLPRSAAPTTPESAPISAPAPINAGEPRGAAAPAAEQQAMSPPTAEAAKAAPSEPAPEPAPAETGGDSTATSTEMAARTPETAPAASAAPPAEHPAPAQPAAYRVQMGAYAAGLGRALRALGKAAVDTLPGNRVEVVRGPAYHTLRSAPIDDLGTARRICATLRSRNVDCFVTRQARPPAGQGFDITGAADPATLAAFLATIEPIEPKTAVANLQPPSDATRPTAATDAATASAPGAYRIQFAAYRRAEHLARGREVLHRKAGDALPAIEALVHAGGPQTTAIPYRLRSVPLESRAAAADLCRSLSEKGVECLVIRHGAKAWRPVS